MREPTPFINYFAYEHMPPRLQKISEPFHALAHRINDAEGLCPREKQVALRKLLEAKDATVRAAL